jgi:hypothetical protein
MLLISGKSLLYLKVLTFRPLVLLMRATWRWRCNGSWVEWHWQEKSELRRDKPVLVPLCAPQISLDWSEIEQGSSQWELQRLTAWAMARLWSVTFIQTVFKIQFLRRSKYCPSQLKVQLVLFRKINFCVQNHTKHSTACGQNEELLNNKADGIRVLDG